jgi:carbamoylphosphate synthase large subunit
MQYDASAELSDTAKTPYRSATGESLEPWGKMARFSGKKWRKLDQKMGTQWRSHGEIMRI